MLLAKNHKLRNSLKRQAPYHPPNKFSLERPTPSLYINDLPDRVENHVKLYADGSKIITVFKDWEDSTNIQKGLSSICEWSNDWLMQVN